MTTYCCVTGCIVSSDGGTRLHQIPKSEDRPLLRERWLKTLNLAGPVPELLFVCEKHCTVVQHEGEEEQDSKSNIPWDSLPIKVDGEDNDKNNLELNLKTFVIYPNKTENYKEGGDVYEILANLQSTEPSSHSNIVTEDLGFPEVNFPATYDIILTNPFLESNTTIELESSENETTETMKPLKNLQEEKKEKPAMSTVKFRKKKKRSNANHNKYIRGIMNSLQKNMKKRVPSKEHARKLPTVIINVDSSDDEAQAIEQPETFTTNGECNPLTNVAQESKHSKSSEVLKLEEKLRMARKRVSEVNQELHRIEQNLKKIFNTDQIHRLKEEHKKNNKWKATTLKKALQLFFTCGESGYKCILNQNYPFPSVNMLQRIIFDYKVGSEVVGMIKPAQKNCIKHVQEIIDDLGTKQTQKT